MGNLLPALLDRLIPGRAKRARQARAVYVLGRMRETARLVTLPHAPGGEVGLGTDLYPAKTKHALGRIPLR